MKTRKQKTTLTIIFSIVTILIAGIGVLLAYLQNHLSNLFSSEAMKTFENTLSFQSKGTLSLVGAIVFYGLVIFALVSFILSITKKKGGYVLPIFSWIATYFALLFLLDSTVGNHNFVTFDYIFAALLLAISVMDTLLPFFYGEEEAVAPVAEEVSSPKAEANETRDESKEKAETNNGAITEKPQTEEKEKEETTTPIVEEKMEGKEKPVENEPVEHKAPNKVTKKAAKKEPSDKVKSIETEEKPELIKAEEDTTAPVPKETMQSVSEKEELDTPKESIPVAKNVDIAITASPAADANSRIAGKYEVYPEAGFFKYRLKANNGEILIVSNGYKTRDGAKKGIETLQKNIANGVTKITTDKKGFAQFRIFTGNDSRLIVAGEIYPNVMGAQSALNSVQKFYRTDKIVDLDEIPESEIREWRITLPDVETSDKGKFEVFADPETSKFRGRLLANNGQVLFVTSTYASKNGVLSAFEKIQKKLSNNDLTVTCDKQGRFQFMIYADNGSVMVMGETYPNRDRAVSAATSAKRFAAKAAILGTK